MTLECLHIPYPPELLLWVRLKKETERKTPPLFNVVIICLAGDMEMLRKSYLVGLPGFWFGFGIFVANNRLFTPYDLIFSFEAHDVVSYY